MNALVVTGFGGPDRLAILERPEPKAGPGQVVIRVHAAALNPIDWKMMEGHFRLIFRQKPPYVPGFDVAGTIESVGDGAGGTPGDRVIASTARGGALAERVVVAASSLARCPARLSFEEAAAIPGAGCTALQGLRDVAGLRAGRSVLVNGASGGVGTYAVQIARALGAEVAATTSSKNTDLVKSLGATRVIDYAREDFARESAAYDVIYDAVGTRSFRECRGALKSGGIYVTTLPSGSYFMDFTLTSVAPFAFGQRRARTVMVRPNARDVAEIALWIDEGKMKSVLDRVVPMRIAEVREAFEHLMSGRARGKIVVALPVATPA